MLASHLTEVPDGFRVLIAHSKADQEGQGLGGVSTGVGVLTRFTDPPGFSTDPRGRLKPIPPRAGAAQYAVMANDVIQRQRRSGYMTLGAAFNGFCLTLLAAREHLWLALLGAVAVVVATYTGYWLLVNPAVETHGDDCVVRGGTWMKKPLRFKLSSLKGWRYRTEASTLTVHLNNDELAETDLRLDADAEAHLRRMLGAELEQRPQFG